VLAPALEILKSRLTSHPGVLLCACMLSACNPAVPATGAGSLQCDAETTPVAVIQGDGYASPLSGSEVIIRGVVTQLVPDSGFYLEEPFSDQSPATSNGIFIEQPSHAGEILPGHDMLISGRVSELGSSRDTLTSLTDISTGITCATGLELPASTLSLPLDSRQREAVEGMRVSIQQQLNVTDVYNFYRGTVTLSANGNLRVPTEDMPPGKAATNQARKNRERSIQAALSPADVTLLRNGSVVPGATGVMGYDDRGQILLIDPPLENDLPPPPGLTAPSDGLIRVVSMNLLNFFNGDGAGGGFPAVRGAKSYDGFIAQSNRIKAALSVMQPTVIAVQELENDGYGELSASRSLLDLLKEAVPADWIAVETRSRQLGGDVIKVGLFYRADILEAVDQPHVLDSQPFRQLSRQPLAQLFRDRASGASFLVVANHLKSKGSCPDSGKNADQQDGQGCWNPARVEAAGAVTAWVYKLVQGTGATGALILGDMNAHRQEDPIRAFRDAGLIDLVEHLSGLPQHSYVYRGEAGTLDYAFATSDLVNDVRHAENWNVNAEWPQKVELPQPWLRYSDHDPVILDLDFSQSATSD
jgi:predicted extracellular nuclease